MPLPHPTGKEDKSSFVSRCMASDVIQKDFSTQSQRLGVCYNLYKRAKKVKASSEEPDWNDFEDNQTIIY